MAVIGHDSPLWVNQEMLNMMKYFIDVDGEGCQCI